MTDPQAITIYTMNIQLEVHIIIAAPVLPIPPAVVHTQTLYIMVVMAVMKVVKCQFNNNKTLKWKGGSHCNNK